MPTRREFLQQAAVLSGSAAWSGAFPSAIAKALAIEPEPDSSFLDAEHVVILMQENRSFDHAFGTLQGVRGFNDPRAISLPNGNPVWVQTNERGESYAPFRLNIKDTNITWAGCLPHGRFDQVAARNNGRYDRWLHAKRSGEAAYAEMPLTLGYYTRDDIPFYYVLADAFTICDQHFCSALTCTTPNRLYLWTGTVREKPSAESKARLWNEDTIYESEGTWKTFPERLEDHGISWKVYQNELTVPSGLDTEHDAWLANYGDNPLEYFAQYHVRFNPSHRNYLTQQSNDLTAEIKNLQEKLKTVADGSASFKLLNSELGQKTALLREVEQQRSRWSSENFEQLSAREKSIHARAFSTNASDARYRELSTHKYADSGGERGLRLPKGDVLRNFREDVQQGKLPTVSWIVAPERFSDHPSSAWYGAWYISEVMDILTRDPKVWKKTVFILTYDENDGYFDHVPPFVAPDPSRPETGTASEGIDTSVEYCDRANELKHRAAASVCEAPIGLGYRVPLIIASPWSRGGCVCSQVFDHTSVLQFLERLLSHKTGRKIEETNISEWRRAVCGDLTSAFQAFEGTKGGLPPSLQRDEFIEGIHRAQFKAKPNGFAALSHAEIEAVRSKAQDPPHMPRQEPGVRRSSPLPYEISADGELTPDRTRLRIHFEAQNQRFGNRAAGSPFIVYARPGHDSVQVRNYAVAAGTHIDDFWQLRDFEKGVYNLRVLGPNGFCREFLGAADDPLVVVRMKHQLQSRTDPTAGGKVVFEIRNEDTNRPYSIEVSDNAYGAGQVHRSITPVDTAEIAVDTSRGLGWYDLSIRVAGNETFHRRYAGRVESGGWGYSDPAMGRVVGDV